MGFCTSIFCGNCSLHTVTAQNTLLIQNYFANICKEFIVFRGISSIFPQKMIVVESTKSVKINPVIKTLQDKRAVYRDHAITAKKDGDKESAIQGLTAVKKCDELIQRIQNGENLEMGSSLVTEIEQLPNTLGQPQSQPPPSFQRSFSRDQPIAIPGKK